MGLDFKQLLMGTSSDKGNSSTSKIGTPEEWVPIKDIRDGIIITKDNRYVKPIEVLPINFLLRSVIEKKGIIFSFRSYLKIAPTNLQIRIINKKADTSAYVDKMVLRYQEEENEKCRELISTYIDLITDVASKEAVTRRFFIVFQYEYGMGLKTPTHEEIVRRLNDEVSKAQTYLAMCGNEIVIPESWDEFDEELLQSLLKKQQEDDAERIPLKEMFKNFASHLFGVEKDQLDGMMEIESD